MFGAANTQTPSTLQVENCALNNNERVAIAAGQNNTTANIINCTLAYNDTQHDRQQISGGTALNVYNTIAVSDRGLFIGTGASALVCDYNIQDAAAGVCRNSPHTKDGIPAFVDTSYTILAEAPSGVGAVDTGVDPDSVIAGVIVAQRQDANGVQRPYPPGGNYDMGAYELAPSPTPTSTSVHTTTKTVTQGATFTATRFTSTPRDTSTRTGTPTRTWTPSPFPTCVSSCVGDCNCDENIQISELIYVTAIALGNKPLVGCPSADADGDENVSSHEQIMAVIRGQLDCLMAPPASDGDIASAIVKIGSPVGTPGDTVEFNIDVLGGASLIGAANVDIIVPMGTFLGTEPIISNPECVIAPGLGADGLRLTNSSAPLAFGTRVLVSQLPSGPMKCPGPTIADGRFAICTAQISEFAIPGYVFPLRGGFGNNAIEGYPAKMSDPYGDPFSTIVVDGKIVVNGTHPPTAKYMSMGYPSTMIAGQEYSVWVTMRNDATTVWTAAPLPQYGLGAVNPVGNTTWGMDRVRLTEGETVEYLEQKTFTWTVTAPSPAGTYDFQWQMVRDEDDGSETWFPNKTQDVQIVVSCPACGCS
jgi:hypothetical protein